MMDAVGISGFFGRRLEVNRRGVRKSAVRITLVKREIEGTTGISGRAGKARNSRCRYD
jgi:hypothetical protein